MKVKYNFDQYFLIDQLYADYLLFFPIKTIIINNLFDKVLFNSLVWKYNPSPFQNTVQKCKLLISFVDLCVCTFCLVNKYMWLHSAQYYATSLVYLSIYIYTCHQAIGHSP